MHAPNTFWARKTRYVESSEPIMVNEIQSTMKIFSAECSMANYAPMQFGFHLNVIKRNTYIIVYAVKSNSPVILKLHRIVIRLQVIELANGRRIDYEICEHMPNHTRLQASNFVVLFLSKYGIRFNFPG